MNHPLFSSIIRVIFICIFCSSNTLCNFAFAQVTQLSPEELRLANEFPLQSILPGTQPTEFDQDNPLHQAEAATLQLIPRFQILTDGDVFHLIPPPAIWCEGHPLHDAEADTRSLFESEGFRRLLEYENFEPAAGMCSGFLAYDAQTVFTAGHCLNRGYNIRQLCENFVFVFGRTVGRTEFSREEVFECDGDFGVQVDTRTDLENFNLLTDREEQDHMILRLTQPVPATTASPIPIRATPMFTGDSATCVGHPDRQPRYVHPMLLETSIITESQDYFYYHMRGNIMPGNSGGPCVDSSGHVFSLITSGDESEIDQIGSTFPTRAIVGDEPRSCLYQSVTQPSISEAIGFSGRSFRDSLTIFLEQTNLDQESAAQGEELTR